MSSGQHDPLIVTAPKAQSVTASVGPMAPHHVDYT